MQTVAEKQELASKEGITPEEEPKKKMEDTTLEEGAGGWLGCEELERVLKANQCKPCKVSLGLSVTDSLSTRTKIKHLVQLLSSEFTNLTANCASQNHKVFVLIASAFSVPVPYIT